VTVWHIKGESPQCLSQLTYPQAWIDRLQWNPISSELAFSVGRQVLVWDALTQTIVTILDFETSSVLDLAWNPQGEYLAVSGNQRVKTWRQRYWEEPPMVQETGATSVAIAWSPNGTYLASGNNDHSTLVWEWGNPYPWRMQGFPGKVRQLAWSTPIKGVDIPMLASTSADEVVLWKKARDPSVGWSAQTLDQHQDTVTAIAFQPVSRMLASAANDGWLCLWRQGNQLIQRLQGAPKGFSALAWNTQGTALASAGRQGEMLVWGPTMQGKGFG
jgi:WD40 repeat protein